MSEQLTFFVLLVSACVLWYSMCLNHHTTFYFYFNKIVELNYTDMKYASGPMQMFPKSLITNRSQGRRLHILTVISKPNCFSEFWLQERPCCRCRFNCDVTMKTHCCIPGGFRTLTLLPIWNSIMVCISIMWVSVPSWKPAFSHNSSWGYTDANLLRYYKPVWAQ